MTERFQKSEKSRYHKLVLKECHRKYGASSNSAWAHMSEDQRFDALMAQAAQIVLVQAEETGKRLSFADAQDMIRACIEGPA